MCKDSLCELVKKLSILYGDSFYLLDERAFESNYMQLLRSFQKIYSKTKIAYSYKTNYIPQLCKRVDELGGAAEVVSEMELNLAKKIGVEYSNIYYNGPYKKELDIKNLLINGGHINIDSNYEIEIIEKIAEEHPQKKLHVGVRCSMDIGQREPSRFGFDVNEIKNVIDNLSKMKNVSVDGLHCHLPYRNLESFEKRMDKLKEFLGIISYDNFEYISMGGGYLGTVGKEIAEQLSYNVPSFDDYAEVVAGQLSEIFDNADSSPMLIIEPGSALAANTLQYVTKVINIKKVRGRHIATLAGSKYQINPSIKNFRRPIKIYPGETEERLEYKSVDMAGYTCIEDDFLYRDYSGLLAKGDFVGFENVGSYSINMKPPFIMMDVPIISVDDSGFCKLIRRAQTFGDIFSSYDI